MSLFTRLFRPATAMANSASIPIASSSRLTLPTSTSICTFSSSPVNMDKLKSHSGTKKRFFKTGGGLYKRGQAGKRHLNTLFSAGRINRLGRTAYASLSQAKKIRRLIPHA